MTSRLRHLARDEAGFSLMELLVAMVIGSIVLTAVMTLFVNGLTAAAKVNDRVEASQRARLTADRISTLLNAQVCGVNSAAPISDAQPTSITLTANVNNVYALPTRYRVRWDSATNNIYEDRWVATGADGNGNPIFPTAVTQTVLIGSQMKPGNGTALFTYYGFDTANGGIASTPMTGTINFNSVVAVDYALTAMPERTKKLDPRATTVQGQAVAGTSDPNDPTRGNTC